MLKLAESFYRFNELYDNGGEAALKEISRKKPVVENRVDPETEKRVVEIAIEQPAYGQVRVSNELKKKTCRSHLEGFEAFGFGMTRRR